MAAAPENTKNKLSLSMEELYKLANAVGLGFEKKIYTKEVVKDLFPVYNKVISYSESIIRKQKVESLYNEEPEPALPTIQEVEEEDSKVESP